MVEEVAVIDGIKIFEFSSEFKLFRHTFADEFARRHDRPFVGFDEDDLYYSNQIFQEFTSYHSGQSQAKNNKRKSNGAIEEEPRPKQMIESLCHNAPFISVKSEIKTDLDRYAPVLERPIKYRKSGVIETIIIDDDSDSDSVASSVDSGTETMRVASDGPPIIEIGNSDSESADSAISLSSPLSLLSAPMSPSPFKSFKPSEKITDRPTIRTLPSAESLKPSNALFPARAHVITVEPTCDKTLSKNHTKPSQDHNTLKLWTVQRKMFPPKEKSPILKENIADREKKNRENVDNGNEVVPAQKPAFTHSLACLSPGVGYIPLLEFGFSIIKFEDPFGTGKVKMYANVMHATKWLNSEVQARLNCDASVELKWSVANETIVQAKRLSRFDFLALSQPNCRITKNGVIFS